MVGLTIINVTVNKSMRHSVNIFLLIKHFLDSVVLTHVRIHIVLYVLYVSKVSVLCTWAMGRYLEYLEHVKLINEHNTITQLRDTYNETILLKIFRYAH